MQSKIYVAEKNLTIKKKSGIYCFFFSVHAALAKREKYSFYYEIPTFLGSEKKLVIN